MERIPDASRSRPRPAPDVHVRTERGRLVVSRRRFGPVRAALVRFVGLKPFLTVHLDPLGSEAWGLLDGRTVGEVRDELAKHHPEIEDLEVRLGRLIGTLVSRRMLDLHELG